MHPDTGLRKARIITTGIAAVGVAGVLVVAGLAHQATAAAKDETGTTNTVQPNTTSDTGTGNYPGVTSGSTNNSTDNGSDNGGGAAATSGGS